MRGFLIGNAFLGGAVAAVYFINWWALVVWVLLWAVGFLLGLIHRIGRSLWIR